MHERLFTAVFLDLSSATNLRTDPRKLRLGGRRGSLQPVGLSRGVLGLTVQRPPV